MTRLTWLRLGWLLSVATLLAVGVLVARRWGSMALVAAAVLLLVPGRVQGHYWRTFFRGRRAAQERRWADARDAFTRFLAELDARPGLRHLVWLAWPGYSTNVRAMTCTNLGAAHLELGDTAAAIDASERALALDAGTPLPWVNLAIAHAARGEAERAAEAARRAQALGYRGGVLDRIQQRLGSALATVEGRAGV